MKSPITQSGSKVVDSFSIKEIIDGYRKDIGIDVTKYFGSMKELPLYECPDTKLRFYAPPSLAGDAAFYTSLEDRPGYYLDWKWEYEKAFHLIEPGLKVLDIGCGRGAFLKKLKEEKDCVVLGLEFNPSAINVLAQKNIPARMQTIEDHALSHPETYDVVTFFQVLEHISSVKSFLTAAIKVLKPGGVMIASVPNNDPYLFGYNKYDWMNLPPHHMGWWNEESLRNIACFFPIKVVDIEACPFHLFNYYLDSRELNYRIMHPKKVWWLKLIRPISKIWIQIIKKRIPGVFIMAIYKKT